MQLRDIGAETIVIRLPNWVGDVVMSTPALRAIRHQLSSARILAVAKPAVLELLHGSRFFDHAIPLTGAGRWQQLWQTARRIREHRPGHGLLFPHSVSSALLFRAARVPRVYGYSTRQRRWLLNSPPQLVREAGRRVPEPMPFHYEQLLAHYGVASRGLHLQLQVQEGEEERARTALAALGLPPEESFFAVNPGASFGSSKLWTNEGFAAAIRELEQRTGIRSLVLCGPGEEALAHDIATLAGPAAIDTSAGRLPLELLKPVLRDTEVLITTDTGPRHIATAFGTPTVVLMGSTDPRYTDCNLERTRVLRAEGVECSPCHLKVCPIDHRCMTWISPAWVVQESLNLINRFQGEREESLHA